MTLSTSSSRMTNHTALLGMCPPRPSDGTARYRAPSSPSRCVSRRPPTRVGAKLSKPPAKRQRAVVVDVPASGDRTGGRSEGSGPSLSPGGPGSSHGPRSVNSAYAWLTCAGRHSPVEIDPSRDAVDRAVASSGGPHASPFLVPQKRCVPASAERPYSKG